MSTEKPATVAEIEDDLTDEERAALMDDDTPDEPEPVEAIAEADETPPPREPEEVPFRASVPEGIERVTSELAEHEAALESKFDEGDITAAEYRRAMREIADVRSKIEWRRQKADLAGDMAEQAENRAWSRDVRDFMETTGAAVSASRPLMVAFDEFVKQVTSDAENVSLSNRQQLDKAHRLFLAGMKKAGVDLGSPEPAVRGDDNGQLDGGRFAVLDRLAATDPDAYEAEVARLADRGEFDAYANA